MEHAELTPDAATRAERAQVDKDERHTAAIDGEEEGGARDTSMDRMSDQRLPRFLLKYGLNVRLSAIFTIENETKSFAWAPRDRHPVVF